MKLSDPIWNICHTTYVFFSHPDYTVGSGFTPDQLLSQVTDFLANIYCQITVGRESTLSYHPAPKNSLFVLHIYFMHMTATCQYDF